MPFLRKRFKRINSTPEKKEKPERIYSINSEGSPVIPAGPVIPVGMVG